MPEVVNIDILDELRTLAAQLRRGVVAPSADDADHVIDPAADEIERLRREVRRLRTQADTRRDVT